jgi:hypothetical protein
MMEGVHFIPYAEYDGINSFKDSEIIGIYRQFEEDGTIDLIFHDDQINNEDEWLEAMKSPRNFLTVAFVDGMPMGAGWFNRMERTTCQAHFGFYKKFWGTPHTDRAIRVICKQMLTNSFHTILGIMPVYNQIAIKFTEKAGFTIVGDIPNLLWSKEEEKPITGTLVRLSREDITDEYLH